MNKIYILRIKEVLIVLLVSLPLGYLIYSKQSEKIYYEMHYFGGKSVGVNFCNVYTPSVNPLLDVVGFSGLNKKLANTSLFSNRDYKVSLSFDSAVNKYSLIFTGNKKDIKVYQEVGSEIFEQILNFEEQNYRTVYSDIKLHCDKSDHALFKYIPGKIEKLDRHERRRFSKFHIFLNSISPFLILSLLLVAFKIVKGKKLLSLKNND